MICKKCMAENKDGSKFCQECGAPLAAPDSAASTASVIDAELGTAGISEKAIPTGTIDKIERMLDESKGAAPHSHGSSSLEDEITRSLGGAQTGEAKAPTAVSLEDEITRSLGGAQTGEAKAPTAVSLEDEITRSLGGAQTGEAKAPTAVSLEDEITRSLGGAQTGEAKAPTAVSLEDEITRSLGTQGSTQSPPVNQGSPKINGQPHGTYVPPVSAPQPQSTDNGRGLAIASLVLASVSLFLCGLIAGPLSIIFGYMAKSKGSKSPMATAGIVIGFIGVGIMALGFIVGLLG